jgi:diaminohydroxyphosphoribosylaminopyrimidine deaminase/5-amino-6-(5-phosphoribosylamino)uracil reductase
LPQTRRIFDPGATVIVFNTLRDDRDGHLWYCRVDDERDLLPAILDRMYGLNLQSVLVEGGTILLESFLRLGAWDEIRRITAMDKRIPGGYPGPLLPKGLKGDSAMIGKDKTEIFTNE